MLHRVTKMREEWYMVQMQVGVKMWWGAVEVYALDCFSCSYIDDPI